MVVSYERQLHLHAKQSKLKLTQKFLKIDCDI